MLLVFRGETRRIESQKRADSDQLSVMSLGKRARVNGCHQITISSIRMIDYGLQDLRVQQRAIGAHPYDPFAWILKCAQPKPLKDILERPAEHVHAALAQMGDKQ